MLQQSTWQANDLVSECCGESSIMELGTTPDWDGAEETWGRCSGCEQIAMFEPSDLWVDLDDEEIAALPSRQLFGPTVSKEDFEPFIDTKGGREEMFLEEMFNQNGEHGIPEFINSFNRNGGPSTISWITDDIAVTSREGADIALKQGHFVINTAEEISNSAQVKIPVRHGGPDNLRQLKAIENVMSGVLKNTNQKVVVHCAMGMERSVTAVVWYLANTTNMSLIEALKLVQSKRPIACDRLYFIAR
jgi:rhodanese-related sulfurtransferase